MAKAKIKALAALGLPIPTTENLNHRAGFVSIIGKPNVGKSTLMNVLIGENLSIITYKAQTTRQRIFGILNTEDYQIVYSDTPGVIQPKYELHRSMMRFVHASLEDADVILLVTDIFEKFDEEDVLNKIINAKVPVIVCINKIDKATDADVADKVKYWQETLPNAAAILPISALNKQNTEGIIPLLVDKMPVHPAYFPKEDLTDKSERFFASEIVREKILLNYHKEVPYSTEVVITEFRDKGDIIVIRANILVERQSQRAIIIGHQGESLKKVGTEARIDLETFFGKKVFLETFVKVEADWRNKAAKLTAFGYNQ